MKKIMLPILLAGMVGGSSLFAASNAFNSLCDALEGILKDHTLAAGAEVIRQAVSSIGEYDAEGLAGDFVRRLNKDGLFRGGRQHAEAYIPMLAYNQSIKLVRDRIDAECMLSGGFSSQEKHLNDLHGKAVLKGKGMLGDFRKYLLKKYGHDYVPQTRGEKLREFFGGKAKRWSVRFLSERVNKELSKSATDRFARTVLRDGGKDVLIQKLKQEAQSAGRDFIAHVELKYGAFPNELEEVS